jgi:hypothetical protein
MPMPFTVIRVAAVLLVATLATPSTPVAAQGLNKADTHDFQMFRQSLAMRHNARVCEQGVPGYGQTFGDLHEKWSEKHRAEIARGESIFREALNKKDPKGQPAIAPATLKRVEERLAELAKPPRATGPTPPPAGAPAAQTIAACERLLTFLRVEG